MNFLEICQYAAGESGVMDPALPLTVVDQEGEHANLVRWVREGWKYIQLRRPRWNWMRRQITFTTSTLQGYLPSAAGITSFSRWMLDTPKTDGDIYYPCTLYTVAEGSDYENTIPFKPWEEFREKYLRGAQTAGRPECWTINPGTGELMLGPAPSEACVVGHEYFKGLQTLTEASHEPEFDEMFHPAIAHRAVMRLNSVDEATPQAIKDSTDQFNSYMAILDREQYGTYVIGGEPLA